nr:hypothetical protein [Tanacetum cinerariifolium]
MVAGSRDRSPMLATGRYAQWKSRFLRYIDTRPTGDTSRKCSLKGLYTPFTVIIPAVPATYNALVVPEQTTVETILNMGGKPVIMYPENKVHYESVKQAIHLLLTGIVDEIYSTVDACKIAHEMWEVIERLQQYESLNIQDVKTNLFREFGKFTSHDGEIIESYYTRNKNVDTTSRYKNDNQTRQFGNRRTVNVAEARETVGSQEAKRVKDSTYHKEKMLLCKQAEKGVPLQAEQSDWLADTDDEIDEQELEAHYNFMERSKKQHSEKPKSMSNTCAVEKVDCNVIPDSPDMCDNDIQTDQNDVKCDDEHVALANLIANLKLDVDEITKIQKQLKK